MATEQLDSTIDLLAQLRAGNTQAQERLIEHCLPPLRKWAHRRLPQFARGMCDTQDLVHDVVLRSLPRLPTFEPRGPGALQGFLRRAVNNQVVDEIRKANRRPTVDDALDTQPDDAPSPLEQAILAEGKERYQAALLRLSPPDRQLIRARFEHHQGYEEIAAATGKPSGNAARMAVSRAAGRLLEAMSLRQPQGPTAEITSVRSMTRP